MGVKGLWNYLEHHNITYKAPSNVKDFEAHGIPYALRPQHLLIDMNAVIHTVYTAKRPTTKATLEALKTYLLGLLRRITPSQTLVVAFDGVAPVAKLDEQKHRRRGMSPQPPAPFGSPYPPFAKKNGVNECGRLPLYTCDVVHADVPLREEEITTGSEFVYACEQYVSQLLNDLVEKGKTSWSTLLLSSCTEPGEGEVKIARYIRHIWRRTVADGRYSADDAISIVGNDSDLIIVSLVATPYQYFTLIDPLDFSMTAVAELLDHWRKAVPNPPLHDDLLASYRVDFAFIMLLSGCDYYDGLRNNAIGLWRTYRHLRLNGGFFRRRLVHGETFDVDTEFMRKLFAKDGPVMANVRTSKNKYATVKAQLRGSAAGSAEEGLALLRGALWNLKSYVLGRCVDYNFTVQQQGIPTVGCLRAAVQRTGVCRKIGGGFVPPRPSPSVDVVAVPDSEPPAVKESDEAAKSPEDGVAETSSAGASPPMTALEQCLAVLGIRGRYSDEIRTCITTYTNDNGVKLTTSGAPRFVMETVKAIMLHVDVDKLTRTEQALLQSTRPALSDDDDVEAAFILYPGKTSKDGKAAPDEVKKPPTASSGSAESEDEEEQMESDTE